ncbi:MAG: OsmC family protein [Nitrospirota bacterium]
MHSDSDNKLKEIVSRRIEFFKKKPEAAIYRPKVSSRHIRGLYTETEVREHTVKADYGEAAGGTNLAPNPIELLLAAFAACIESAFYEFALHEGLSADSVSVDVEGSLDLRGLFMVDEDVPPGFSDIKYVINIKTSEDRDKVQRLAEKVIAHCPVVDSLVRRISISGTININNQEG